MKIDAFAHFLPPRFYQTMLTIAPDIPQRFPFINIKNIVDLDSRIQQWPEAGMKQVISLANISPEDFCEPAQASEICRQANSEISSIVAADSEHFEAGVAALPMNDVPQAVAILDDVAHDPHMVGAQIFTRHLGKSIANPQFEPVLAKAAELGLPLWLHPVFDVRKPDNELVFSWEYELSQAMLQLVQANTFEKYPNLKILVHHAGAMAPFFAGRIEHIMPEKATDFKRFYVDTAILGNTPALQLTIDYFGVDRVLFGTDAPFAVMPSGANEVISKAIDDLNVSVEDKQKIYIDNYNTMLQA